MRRRVAWTAAALLGGALLVRGVISGPDSRNEGAEALTSPGARGPTLEGDSARTGLGFEVGRLTVEGGERPAVREAADPAVLPDESPARAEWASELRGRVTLDGGPLQGVPVRIARKDEYPRWIRSECTTDAGGSYSLRRLTPGEYVVEALPAGLPKAAAIVVLTGGHVSIQDLAIVSGGVLRGRVLDRDELTPIAGAEVAPRNDFRQGVWARVDGSFVVVLAQGAEYPRVVGARAPGYADAQRVLVEPPGDDFEILLERGVRVRGSVHAGQAPQSALAGAEVTIAARETGQTQRVDLKQALTDSSGAFVVEGVARDLDHVLIVRMSGYGTHVGELGVGELGVREPGASELGSAADVPELDVGIVHLDPAASLGGRVLDGDGNGLGGFEIRVRRIQPAPPRAWEGIEGWLPYVEATFSSESGRYFVDDLEAGTYSVVADWPGIERSWRASLEVTLGRGQSARDVDFFLDAEASIAGRVVGPAGLPVRGAFLTLATRGEYSRPVASLGTGEDGVFRFDGIGAGAYKVNVQIDSAANSSDFGPRLTGASFDVTPGSEGLELALLEAASISGFVLDANEQMVSAAFVMALMDGYQTVDSAMTDENGAFLLSNVGGVVDLAVVPSVEDPKHGIRVPDRSLGHVRLPAVVAGSTDVVLRLPYVVDDSR